MKILLLEDDYLQAESIENELHQKIRNAEVVVLKTESEFYSYLDELAANSEVKVPDVAILDVMVPWETPTENMTKPPPEIRTEGSYRAGIRCVKKLLNRGETKGIKMILYSILEKEDIAQDLRSLPKGVTLVTKRQDLDELIDALYQKR